MTTTRINRQGKRYTPPAPPFRPLREDGAYDRAAIMAEAHSRVTMLREIEPWTGHRATFPAALRQVWNDAQRLTGDVPIPDWILEELEAAEAERIRAG